MKLYTADGIEVVEVENLSVDEVREKLTQAEADKWHDVSNKTRFLIYTPQKFIDRAYKHLDENPPDLKQASEKIWGLVAHIIKKFFIDIDCAVKSHRATKTLALFLFGFHEDRAKDRRMTEFFKDAETCHRNFYTTYFSKNELKGILAEAQKFISDVAEIPKEKVQQVLMNHINGTETKTFLEKVEFKKDCITEELEGKKITSVFTAN